MIIEKDPLYLRIPRSLDSRMRNYKDEHGCSLVFIVERAIELVTKADLSAYQAHSQDEAYVIHNFQVRTELKQALASISNAYSVPLNQLIAQGLRLCLK